VQGWHAKKKMLEGEANLSNKKELNEFGQLSLAKQKLRSNSLVLSVNTSRGQTPKKGKNT